MMPKDFIQSVLITEIKDVVDRHPYLSFLLICVGIEFLGKCHLIDSNYQDWNNINADKAFKKGAELIAEIDPRYEVIDLKNELRNGFAHTFLPKSKIALSEIRHGARNFQVQNGQTIIVAEEFYRDFVIACKLTIEKPFPIDDKMNKEFLSI